METAQVKGVEKGIKPTGPKMPALKKGISGNNLRREIEEVNIVDKIIEKLLGQGDKKGVGLNEDSYGNRSENIEGRENINGLEGKWTRTVYWARLRRPYHGQFLESLPEQFEDTMDYENNKPPDLLSGL